MNNASLELGGTNWAEKDGNILGYSVGDTSGKYSPQEFTFARGSNLSATRIDRAGLIVKGRENVLTYSNDFSNVVWFRSNTTITSGQSGYDGSSDAWSWISTTAYGSHRIIQTFTGVSNSIVTYSVFAKSNGYDFLRIVENASTGDFATFNLSNGSVANNTGIANTAIIASVGNGWYRCSISIDGGNTTRFDIYTMETSGATDFLGDGVSGAYIQDAQVELGLAASPYIETTTTSAQAGVLENTPRLNYTTGVANPYLLLEPSRTNLVTQSEYIASWIKNGNGTGSTPIINANSAISPEGLNNASRVDLNLNGGLGSLDWSWVYQNFTTSGNNETFSFYIKALDSSNVGKVITFGHVSYDSYTLTSDWVRIETTASASAGNYPYGFRLRGSASTSNTASFYVYGAQMEVGSYPTSYIPTYSVSATRAADACSKTNASDVIGQSEGTLFVDFVWNGLSDNVADNVIMSLGAQSYGVSNIAISNYNGSLYARVTNGVNVDANIFALILVAGTRYKCLITYTNNDVKFYVNGVLEGSDTSVSIPAVSDIYLQNNFPNSKNINQSLVFSTVLTNAEAITLTTI